MLRLEPLHASGPAADAAPPAATRLGLGARLTLAFGALAAVTLLVVLLAWGAGRQATEDIERTQNVRTPAWIASERAQASLLKMQLHVRGYLVLGDPQDIEQYKRARHDFETSLAALQAMARSQPEADEAQWVEQLTQTYEGWAKLPQQLVELHDDPLRNRPAMRIARVELQPLHVRVLDEIDVLINLQKARGSSADHRVLLRDLRTFQTSFDAMATSLIAYATSGELNFKLAYGPHLAANATAWNALAAKRSLLTPAQRTRLDALAQHRTQAAELGLSIVSILNGEHAYEDLYLYRTTVSPQAEVLIALLGKITSTQEAQLKNELAHARTALDNASTQTIVGGLLALALGIGLAMVFRRRIVGPVVRLTGVAGRVARGDLSARAVVEGRDEIGVLATSVNTMTQRLSQTIAHLEAAIADAERAKDEAVVANRAKSTFLATMSHELRTPLNAILGYARILKYDEDLDRREAGALDTIQRSGEHLLALINDILDLSRIEAGKVELHPEPAPLADFLHAIAEIIGIKAREKGLSFEFAGASGAAQVVHVDAQRLRQVLLNLLSNAVKFTERGSVNLRVSQAAEGEGTARLRFEVADTGMGIAPEHVERIFQPFEQIAEMQRRFGGTGLGLSISRQLVRLMGGEIHVESRAGEGARFWFELTLPTAAREALREPLGVGVRTIGYEGRQRTVLVADDVEANRRMLVDLLSWLGFGTLEAENGDTALQQAQSLQPDLILMDAVMPGLDGLEATRRLRAIPALRHVPIIVISASALAAERQASLAGGATAFLPKPVDLDQLLHDIGTLLHLTWVHAQTTPAAAQKAQPTEPLVPPPDAEIEALYDLARTGNMRRIRDHANRIEGMNTTYAPFSRRLRELADNCQSRAILDLAVRFRDRQTEE